MDATTSYEQLLSIYNRRDLIPYYELLNILEWKSKRATIIARDKYKCQNCSMSETIYLDRAPYHFHLEGENDYDLIEDEDGIIIGARRNLRLVPALRNVSFHVHHTYYILNCNPWEYSEEALLTLCSYCHFELHKSITVQWVDADNIFSNLTPCPRCNGAGSFPEYSHVQGGRCFYCKGAMYKEFMA